MEQSILDQEELNKRANEVFDLRIGDYIYDVIIDDDSQVVVPMRLQPQKLEKHRMILLQLRHQHLANLYRLHYIIQENLVFHLRY